MTSALKVIPAFLICQPNDASVVKTEFHFNEKQIKKGLLQMNEDAQSYLSREKFKEKFDSTYDIMYKYKFNKLLSSWKANISYSSSPETVLNNPNFKEIVKLGKIAIPLILEEIATQPSVLVWALNLITGRRISENNVSVSEASKLWVNWGKLQRLIG